MDYDDLHAKAKSRWGAENTGGDFSEWLKTKTKELSASAQDGRELSRMIVAKLARIAGIGGPAVIAFFSPPYYPSVPPRENEITRAMSAALARQADAAALSRCAELVEAVSKGRIQRRGFYPYISDLSYLQLDSEIEIESLAKNMPLFGLKDSAGDLFCSLDEERSWKRFAP
ncbi:MAG: hypothetical protein U0X92_11615 [Anaerolineales bacterium]